MSATNTTPQDIRKRLELELIDDAFCDVFSEYPADASHAALGRAIERLQAWRRQYGLTYEPFEGEDA